MSLELSRRNTGRTLHIFDEPTTGQYLDKGLKRPAWGAEARAVSAS